MAIEDSDGEGVAESESHKFHLGKKMSKLTDYIFKGKNMTDSHSSSFNSFNKSDINRSVADLVSNQKSKSFTICIRSSYSCITYNYIDTLALNK